LDLLLAIIRRDFLIQEGETPALAPDDCDALKWWITEVLPIAAGNQVDWQAEHCGFMTVRQGHCSNEPNKLCVTDSTEAIAVWIIENNCTCWPAQWAAKDLHSDLPIIHKAKRGWGGSHNGQQLGKFTFFGAVCDCFASFATSNAWFGPFQIHLGQFG